jgi:hypothetical protein
MGGMAISATIVLQGLDTKILRTDLKLAEKSEFLMSSAYDVINKCPNPHKVCVFMIIIRHSFPPLSERYAGPMFRATVSSNKSDLTRDSGY